MSAQSESCPLELLVVVVVRELAAAGMQQSARKILEQAVAAIGYDAASDLWYELYGRHLFPDD